LSNAAKDDFLTANEDGTFTFKIADLLANDAGGANKIGAGQFFFGSGHDNDTPAAQQAYMDAHGIKLNADGVTYTVENGDFDYSVQIGNKGTWSTAHVDVAPHEGKLLFADSFEGYTNVQTSDGSGGWAAVELSKGDWTTSSGTGQTEVTHTGYFGVVDSSDGNYWLDTQGTSGGIDIAHQFTDPNGGQVKVSFDLSTENFAPANITAGTDPNAAFQFKIDDTVVATITVQDILTKSGGLDNKMVNFDFIVDVTAGEHTLHLADVTPADHASPFGFALDNVQVHDWII
jgi:hypothetical protein